MAVGPNILILIRLVLYAILGMAVGSERNNVHEFIRNQQCFEVTVCALTLITMLTTIALVFLENVQFVKEHLNYWFCLNTFYFSKLTTDLLQQSLCSIMYVSIIYYRTSQPRDATCYFKVLTICVLTSLVLQSNGRLITFLWMCAVNKMSILAALLMLFSLYWFFLMEFHRPTLFPTCITKWLSFSRYTYYGFEGIMVSIYGRGRQKMECTNLYCPFKNSKQFLESMGMGKAEYWNDAAVLIGNFVLSHFVTYQVFCWKIHSMR